MAGSLSGAAVGGGLVVRIAPVFSAELEVVLAPDFVELEIEVARLGLFEKRRARAHHGVFAVKADIRELPVRGCDVILDVTRKTQARQLECPLAGLRVLRPHKGLIGGTYVHDKSRTEGVNDIEIVTLSGGPEERACRRVAMSHEVAILDVVAV